VSQVFLEKLAGLWPEIVMLIGAVVCLMTGLSPSDVVRRRVTPWLAGLTLAAAGVLAILIPCQPVEGLGLGHFAQYIKLAVVGVGIILLLVAAHTPEGLAQNRLADASSKFDAGQGMRGEFFAFFLFSLTGVMLTAGASDLVWLFLALELTSLPTYVLVATSRDRMIAQESAVKYFFLGAMSAAIFLYGFALIYGATGFTDLNMIAQSVATTGITPLMLTGVILAVLGICFKIAAFPMHFYAADVYQGAAIPITAFLAFVPKTAGFAALILVLMPLGEMPQLLVLLLSAIAVLTMTIGNVLALLQTNVKRVLAYSSVAHSGYLLVALITGLVVGREDSQANVMTDGLAAVLFYLVAYAAGTIGSFAIFGCLARDGREIETYDDLAGIRRRHPLLAWVLLFSVISLLGIPPLVGFVGKIFIIGSAYTGELVALVICMVINSAISAGYYLRIASVAFFSVPRHTLVEVPSTPRRLGAALAAALTLLLGFLGNFVLDFAHDSVHESKTETTVDVEAEAISNDALEVSEAPANYRDAS